MSLTLKQVQPLLTQAELELFQSSRATAIRSLNERQLVARTKRTRALRDKYRDLYRRQTVRSRAGVAVTEANRRTDLKAQVMADVLERFEAQSAKLQAQAAKAAAKKATAAKKVPAKKASTTTAPAKKAAAKKAPTGKPAARKPPAKKKPLSSRNAITGAAKPASTLMKQVRKAVAKQQATAPVEGAPRARRAIRAVVGGSATDNAQGAVPTNMPAKAQRLNPLKAKPINKKIHASARGRQTVHTAKRDAR